MTDATTPAETTEDTSPSILADNTHAPKIRSKQELLDALVLKLTTGVNILNQNESLRAIIASSKADAERSLKVILSDTFRFILNLDIAIPFNLFSERLYQDSSNQAHQFKMLNDALLSDTQKAFIKDFYAFLFLIYRIKMAMQAKSQADFIFNLKHYLLDQQAKATAFDENSSLCLDDDVLDQQKLETQKDLYTDLCTLPDLALCQLLKDTADSSTQQNTAESSGFMEENTLPKNPPNSVKSVKSVRLEDIPELPASTVDLPKVQWPPTHLTQRIICIPEQQPLPVDYTPLPNPKNWRAFKGPTLREIKTAKIEADLKSNMAKIKLVKSIAFNFPLWNNLVNYRLLGGGVEGLRQVFDVPTPKIPTHVLELQLLLGKLDEADLSFGDRELDLNETQITLNRIQKTFLPLLDLKPYSCLHRLFKARDQKTQAFYNLLAEITTIEASTLVEKTQALFPDSLHVTATQAAAPTLDPSANLLTPAR